MNKPWTHEELQAMIPALKTKLQESIEQTEAEELANHNSIVRGLPHSPKTNASNTSTDSLPPPSNAPGPTTNV